MTYEAKEILIIEDATQEGRDFVARAIVFENDLDTDALSVKDILEHENIDVLRDAVKDRHPNISHYRQPVVDGTSEIWEGGWSDALRIAKERAYEEAIKEGADVRKNMSLRHLSESNHKAIAAREAREVAAAEQKEAAERRDVERKERAAERRDFDAWTQMARAARDDDKKDYQLACAMRWAFAEVEGWEKKLADHVEKLTSNPTYALSWSGDFVQSASDYEVAAHVVEVFNAGASFDEMEDMAMRELFNKGDRATSRSTSVVSNLTDDCTRVAWNSFAKRITGRSFW